jgi:hypothetical protein
MNRLSLQTRIVRQLRTTLYFDNMIEAEPHPSDNEETTPNDEYPMHQEEKRTYKHLKTLQKTNRGMKEPETFQ